MEGAHLAGRKIALIGGDRRSDYLGARLAEFSSEVVVARRRPPRLPGPHHVRDVATAVRGASVLVCPMSRFGPGGRVWSEDPEDFLALTPQELALLERPSIAFAGSFSPELAAAAGRVSCEPVSLADLDELAIANSVPTAEGAILMALERTTVTLHGSRAVVLGYGRTGQTMAATLHALGAKVTVVARRAASQARAIASGCEAAVGFDRLAEAVTGARFVFNTIPSLVLVGNVLSRLHPSAVIVDLASGEGGTDFAAAGTLGLTAVLAPALPGRVAPETSAAYLADIIIRLSAEHFA